MQRQLEYCQPGRLTSRHSSAEEEEKQNRVLIKEERNVLENAKLDLPSSTSTTSVWPRQTKKLKIGIEGRINVNFLVMTLSHKYAICYLTIEGYW